MVVSATWASPPAGYLMECHLSSSMLLIAVPTLAYSGVVIDYSHPQAVEGLQHGIRIESRIGAQAERPPGSGSADPIYRLGHEADIALLGAALPETSRDHLAGVGPGRYQRVIAKHSAVSEPGAFFVLAVHLDNRRVHIYGHRSPTRACPADHTRLSVWSNTASKAPTSSWSNERRNVPSVDGAITRCGNTPPVAPARSRSA